MPTLNLPLVRDTSPEAFIEERRYCANVTPATLAWYNAAFKVFTGCTVEEEFKARIVQLRKARKSPVSINTWLRVMNAYLHWVAMGSARKCSAMCDHLKVPRLQEDDKILETLSQTQVGHLLKAKPAELNARRAQVLAVIILDTGLRIAEVLSLHRRDVDLDNMLVTVMGKGRKQRRVPLSLEGRKWLYQWTRGIGEDEYVFWTSSGAHLSIRNAQRDLRALCAHSGVRGVRCSPHTLRHTFAVSYLRAGGNLEYLRRILGHSQITITQRYLRSLQPEDLGRVHNALSPLSQI